MIIEFGKVTEETKQLIPWFTQDNPGVFARNPV